jgi:hypothetical protein
VQNAGTDNTQTMQAVKGTEKAIGKKKRQGVCRKTSDRYERMVDNEELPVIQTPQTGGSMWAM